MKPSRALIRRIKQLIALPGGRHLLAAVFNRAIPYTGTIRPMVIDVGDGRAEVAMNDRRIVRNHLQSIHALALANLGELTANLAITSLQPEDSRWIVIGLAVDYVKKARGRVTAIAEAPVVDWDIPNEATVEAVIRDTAGDVVAKVRCTIKLAPTKRAA